MSSAECVQLPSPDTSFSPVSVTSATAGEVKLNVRKLSDLLALQTLLLQLVVYINKTFSLEYV